MDKFNVPGPTGWNATPGHDGVVGLWLAYEQHIKVTVTGRRPTGGGQLERFTHADEAEAVVCVRSALPKAALALRARLLAALARSAESFGGVIEAAHVEEGTPRAIYVPEEMFGA